MDLITKVLYRLSLFTSPQLDLYVPATTDCVVTPVNYTSVVDICPSPGYIEAGQTADLPPDIARLVSFFNDSECLTPGCIQSAADIYSNLDETADPCEDFYQFACGNWMDKRFIPDYNSKTSVLYDTQSSFYTKLKNLLQEDVTEKEPYFIQLVKTLYQSCMDTGALNSEPLKSVLKNFGRWPVVEGEKWNSTSFDWLETLIQLRESGFSHNTLMSLSVTEDPQDSLVNIIELGEPSLGVDCEFLKIGLNDSNTANYFNKMLTAANYLGVNRSTSEHELRKALEFEIMLANFCSPHEQRENMYYTVDELINDIQPQIDWLKLFNGLLNDQIFENETVIVKNVDFVRKFADFITKAEKRTVANYMMWRVVKESLPLLSSAWTNLQDNPQRTRWKYCFSTVNKNLGIALASYYLQNYFDEESQAKALKIFEYIQEEVYNMLENIDWMDFQTNVKAKEKVIGMRAYFQYPTKLLNNTYVSDLYAGLTFSNETYFDKEMIVKKWSTDISFSKLRKFNTLEEKKKRVRTVFNPLGNSNGFPELFVFPLFIKDRTA
ncbi:neprilysin-2-like [Stegodyphus dumicola]|uniref:neprilysin-2-like n=1 Tax=Stegodyphus dumicola TaxID=202533 RepID=UPI0015ADC259|nr:neprilysin-2-like [Stegodyphus dumicola]